MNVFLDFEASSLDDRSYPIEVAWVFEDERSESHLIAPAPDWTDWNPDAERIHGIAREILVREGVAHDVVAARMVEQLTGHSLFASAPSWDGKWLSALLRAAGLPRHTLRLKDTDIALRETAEGILRGVVPQDRLEAIVNDLMARANATKDNAPAHRALADAREERSVWQRLRDAATALAEASEEATPAAP
ncbi:transcriptional regulator [Sphingomonas sp. CFBP8993]|uniref:3'-5' exonuclease n=1 Tax=Sphingomonas sp. CFBP8993 TaxID=3096526 RepID=UPI002A6B2C49|nr:transcriptional regulator [Sphingomonas sp. CFBP8993]MDY0957258.1 transcriptional regulator [Sphingomonas sp. CFBP8993]